MENEYCESWRSLSYMLEGRINVLLITTEAGRSLDSNCMMELMPHLLNRYLAEELYAASVAGFRAHISLVDQALLLEISGFSEKLHMVVDSATKSLRKCLESLEASHFEAARNEMTKKTISMKPEKLAGHLGSNLLLTNGFNPLYDDQELTFEEFKEFSDALLQQLEVRILIEGSIRKKRCLEMTENILENLQCMGIDDVSFLSSSKFQQLLIFKINFF